MKKIIYLFVAAIVIVSCGKMDNANNSGSAANMTRMQEFYDQVMNAHNPAMIDSFCTSDFVDHQADPRYPQGMAGLKASFTDFFTAFPDLHVTTNFMKSWGDTCMAHLTMTGTNSGAFMGMPPTNKQINVQGVDFVVIKDGKATEHWGYQEEMKMMSQMGMGGGGGGAMADSSMKK